MRFPDFPGHFPGEPLVPGAALLVAVDAAVAATGAPLAEVVRVRFLEPVRPGEDVDIVVRDDGDLVRFEVVGAGRMRVRGAGRRAKEAPTGVGGAG